MSSGTPRTWSSRTSRLSRPSSRFSFVESNFRVSRPETPIIPEVKIQPRSKTRSREISINDAPMMLLPKARVRDSLGYYEKTRRPYSVVEDSSTQGLHISTIQSFDTMEPRILPKSALKSRRESVSRSDVDSGISSLKRAVTFENLYQSQSTVFKSDDEFENLSDLSSDEKDDLDHNDRLPLLVTDSSELPDHLDTFGGGEAILLNPPRPPSGASSAQPKRRKHNHADDREADMCELCGTILSDTERVQRSFGKVDTFLDWVMGKWGKRQELQYIPRPSYVYRGHTPHFCNFVQQVPLHSKNGGATDSTGIPDSEIDEMEFITESIEGRLINKWRKGSAGSPSGSITLSRMPKLDDYVSDDVAQDNVDLQNWLSEKRINRGLFQRYFSSIPETKEDLTASGTEGRPGSPSSLDDGETKSELDDAQRRPVTGVEVKVTIPLNQEILKPHPPALSNKPEPKEEAKPYKSNGVSIPEVDEGGATDKRGGAWDDDKSAKNLDPFRIEVDDSSIDHKRPPSPSRPPPSPEPILLVPTPEPPTPKPSRKKGCVKKTKKPVERTRKMKEPEPPKEPDPPKVEEVTEPEPTTQDSDKADLKVDLQVPELPSAGEGKDKSKKDKSKPKRHLIEIEDDLFKPDPTDLLNEQMRQSRVDIDWSGMDINGMDEIKKPQPIKSWITGRLALSQQASRFELPMDMKTLEKMTPQEYVKKHCIISSRRQNLYQKIFLKNKDKSQVILYKDLDKTLKDVLVNTITSTQVQDVLNLLEIDENTRVDQKLFAGMAAFAERVLYPKYVTEDTQDMPEYQKERIECADFCALDWKFHGVNVNPHMSKLLHMIS